MIECGGVFLPDGEKHLVEWMRQRNELVDGKLTYQHHKLKAALEFVQNWDTAIDVGAHAGLWSMHLVQHFRQLIAFEPIEEHRACFTLNVPDWEEKVVLFNCALGDRPGWALMETGEASSGDTHVKDHGGPHDLKPPAGARGMVELKTMDSLVPSSTPVGFLKIDVEGFEEPVVRGGAQLIQRQRPVICVEQKPHVLQRNFGSPEPKAVRLLQSWGYDVRRELSGDFILTG